MGLRVRRGPKSVPLPRRWGYQSARSNVAMRHLLVTLGKPSRTALVPIVRWSARRREERLALLGLLDFMFGSGMVKQL
jgi:hypothetical protein